MRFFMLLGDDMRWVQYRSATQDCSKCYLFDCALQLKIVQNAIYSIPHCNPRLRHLFGRRIHTNRG